MAKAKNNNARRKQQKNALRRQAAQRSAAVAARGLNGAQSPDWTRRDLTFGYGGGAAALTVWALLLAVFGAGNTLESAFRALTIAAGALSLAGALACFVAHFGETSHAKHQDAAGKMLLVMAAFVVLLSGILFTADPAKSSPTPAPTPSSRFS